MPSTDQPRPTTNGKWLSIVGIGEDGAPGLGDEARRLVAQAATVFGGKRHLSLATDLIEGEERPWPSPFDAAIKAVTAMRGTSVCVLASGDPFLHGVGAALARQLPAEEMFVIPHASAFSLAAARLGWPLQDTETVSLHGRSTSFIRPLLHPGRNILALTSDQNGPAELAGYLTRHGFGGSKIHVLEALGGEKEVITTTTANDFSLTDTNPLNLVGISVSADMSESIVPLTPGMADELFQHDGQITKREIRAITLAALAPRRGELLLDIGAGAGSICIEWMLRHPSMQAIAIEKNPDRAARIGENADRLGVPDLTVIEGSAPDALAGLDAPDAIFIGGGGSSPEVANKAIEQLKTGGRLVANAVTLQMESALLDLHSRFGGDLSRLAVSRVDKVGTMNGWRPAMPVTQWIWTKS